MTTAHQPAGNVRPLRIDKPDPFATAWTADALMAARFPAPKWAVPGLLAEGVSLLAAPPKAGKSWVSLGLALSIAAGTPALGSIPVIAGPVLYLALEDTPRRLQGRMRKLLHGRPAPADLTLVTQFPPLPQGGDAAIAGWLAQHPTARLVVIDVFAKIRGASAPGQSAYEADYAAVSRIKRVADHYAVAVVLVHHVRKDRKANNDDFLEEISGTNGVAGAADTTIVLKRPRGQADGVLYVTGRDVEENEHAMSFDPDTGTWLLLDGPASDHTISDTRAAILRTLRDHGTGLTPAALADRIDINRDLAKKTCTRMVDAGQLTTDGTGHYYAPIPDVNASTTPSTVPTVPEPPFAQVEGQIGRGHPRGHGVPGVPDHAATTEGVHR